MNRHISLSATFNDLSSAKRFVSFFRGATLQSQLNMGNPIEFEIGPCTEVDRKFYVAVYPTQKQIRTSSTHVALSVCNRLRLAPPFRAAFIGLSMVSEQSFVPGLVLNTEVWKLMDSPAQFVNFSDGNVWIPILQVIPFNEMKC